MKQRKGKKKKEDDQVFSLYPMAPRDDYYSGLIPCVFNVLYVN